MTTETPPQHVFVAERMFDSPEFHEEVERVLEHLNSTHTFVGNFEPGDMTQYRMIAHRWGNDRDRWSDHSGNPILFQFGTTTGAGMLMVFGHHVLWVDDQGMSDYTKSVAEIVLGHIRAAFGHPLLDGVLPAWDAYRAAAEANEKSERL